MLCLWPIDDLTAWFLDMSFDCPEGPGEEDLEKIAEQEQKQFSFETLLSATKDFHPTNKLGEGGFGPVYKVNISL